MTSGLASDSDDFEVELMRSPRAIGSEKFREHVDVQYSEMLAESRSPEDISFRRTREL